MGAESQPWPWFAIQARTGREKYATSFVQDAGYEVYMPVSRCDRRWSDRTKRVDVPLFPAYFFCRMNPNHRLPVLMAPGVIQIVGIGKAPTPVGEGEISAILRAEQSSLPIAPWPYLQVGQ